MFLRTATNFLLPLLPANGGDGGVSGAAIFPSGSTTSGAGNVCGGGKVARALPRFPVAAPRPELAAPVVLARFLPPTPELPSMVAARAAEDLVLGIAAGGSGADGIAFAGFLDRVNTCDGEPGLGVKGCASLPYDPSPAFSAAVAIAAISVGILRMTATDAPFVTGAGR